LILSVERPITTTMTRKEQTTISSPAKKKGKGQVCQAKSTNVAFQKESSVVEKKRKTQTEQKARRVQPLPSPIKKARRGSERGKRKIPGETSNRNDRGKKRPQGKFESWSLILKRTGRIRSQEVRRKGPAGRRGAWRISAF